MTKKNKKILLLDLYVFKADLVSPEERAFIQAYMYLGAYLEHLGIEYDIYRWHGKSDDLIKRIKDNDIEAVFINLILGKVLAIGDKACRIIKKAMPNVKIWVGGLAIHFIADVLKQHECIDHVSFSDPRKNLKAFVDELKAYKILNNSDRAFDKPVYLTNSKQLSKFTHQHKTIDGVVNAIDLTTANGCKNTCSFCYLSRIGNYQQTSDDFINEITQLSDKHNIRYFEFTDDNFCWPEKRFQEIYAGLKSSGIQIYFFCLLSIDVINKKLLDQLCEVGLQKVFIGIDSINPTKLKEYRKGYSEKEIYQAIELLRTYPIDLTLSLILGSPGETKDDLQHLYDWTKAVAPEICTPLFFSPYPGTRLYEQMMRQGFSGPKTLEEWGILTDLNEPTDYFLSTISRNEYLDWEQRFDKLSTFNFRSKIGPSMRKYKRKGSVWQKS